MENLILTLIIGLAGGIIALRLKVPAGAMVGAMLAIAIFNIITGAAYFPQNIRLITQMAAGAFIGARVKHKDIKDLRLVIKPAILMVSGMIILDLIIGYIMYKVTDIDLVTSLFACAPGGIVDMSIVSSDLGADSSKVAILQLVRLMSVMMLLPTLLKIVTSKVSNKSEVNKNVDENLCISSTEGADLDGNSKENKKATINSNKKNKYINLLLTAFVSFAGGITGYLLKVPAGAMTFSMVAVATLNISYNRAYMPLNIRRLTQVFAGILIGARMTYGDLIALKSVLIPAVVLLIGIIAVNLFLGFFISKVSEIDIVTSLFASAPGGMSDMALIAEDLGADSPKVAILQLARYVCVIAFYPIIIKFITSLM